MVGYEESVSLAAFAQLPSFTISYAPGLLLLCSSCYPNWAVDSNMHGAIDHHRQCYALNSIFNTERSYNEAAEKQCSN